MLLASLSLLLVNQKLMRQSLMQFSESLPLLSYKCYTLPTSFVLKITSKSVRPTAYILKGTFSVNLNILNDIAVVDYVKNKGRFGLNYLFLSSFHNYRFTLNTFTNETTPLPSLLLCSFSGVSLFSSAGWLEREV